MNKGRTEGRDNVLTGEGQAVEVMEGETEQERRLEASAGAKHIERVFLEAGALS